MGSQKVFLFGKYTLNFYGSLFLRTGSFILFIAALENPSDIILHIQKQGEEKND